MWIIGIFCVVVHSEKDIMLLPDTKIIVVSNKEKARKAVEVMQNYYV